MWAVFGNSVCFPSLWSKCNLGLEPRVTEYRARIDRNSFVYLSSHSFSLLKIADGILALFSNRRYPVRAVRTVCLRAVCDRKCNIGITERQLIFERSTVFLSYTVFIHCFLSFENSATFQSFDVNYSSLATQIFCVRTHTYFWFHRY